MINWRTLMEATPELPRPTQYTQNTQKGGVQGSFDHIEDIDQGKQCKGVVPIAPLTTLAVEGAPFPVLPPIPPLQAGWLVVYRDQQGRLAGGCDDRQHGTVKECRWGAGAWTVTLTDGQTMPLFRVRSVGAVDHNGRLYGAWEVRKHGYDGMKGERSQAIGAAIPAKMTCEEAVPDTRAA